MRLRLFALCVALAACSNGFWANCAGYRPQCCTDPDMAADVTYVGTTASGATVTIRRNSASDTVTLTFLRNGTTVVERFQPQYVP